jgi:hypothetical protein
MKKRTLQFNSLVDVARFAKSVTAGYLINTNKFTLTGNFSEEEINNALGKYNAKLIETSEYVFSYK